MTEEDKEDDGSVEESQPIIRNNSSQEIISQGKLKFVAPANPVVDPSVVSLRWYTCFGSNLFPNKTTDLKLLAGITSPSPGEGKTHVAANLATFLALDTQEDTVLVDLNFRRPKLHEVFGIPAAPGILEAVPSESIIVSRCSIKGLWILPLGTATNALLTFEKTLDLREVLTSLKRRFRFVIVDLPAALEDDFPIMVANQLDGSFVVVSAGKTKSTEIDRTIHVLNEKKVMGFVMNKVPGGFLP